LRLRQFPLVGRPAYALRTGRLRQQDWTHRHSHRSSLKTVNSYLRSNACYGGGFKPATNAFGALGVVFPAADETDN